MSPWSLGSGSHTPIKLKCQDKDYHIYDTIPNRFKEGKRCPYCNPFASHKVHILDSLGTLYPISLEVWSDKNDKTPFEYSPMSKEKVWWKCKEERHEDYYRSIDEENINNFLCSNCCKDDNESILQKCVRLYLEELSFNILHEQYCTLNPVNKTIPPNHSNNKRRTNMLRYDNEIVVDNKNLIIEVHGSYHYEPFSTRYIPNMEKYNTTREEEFQYQVDRDSFKEQYALDNKYEYLIISYKDIERTESYKTLINNKIEEIKTKYRSVAS